MAVISWWRTIENREGPGGDDGSMSNACREFKQATSGCTNTMDAHNRCMGVRKVAQNHEVSLLRILNRDWFLSSSSS